MSFHLRRPELEFVPAVVVLIRKGPVPVKQVYVLFQEDKCIYDLEKHSSIFIARDIFLEDKQYSREAVNSPLFQ
jgi:hypothetical protein